MDNKEKLKKLELMAEGLRRELSDTNQDIATLKLKICKEDYGLEVGVVVLDRSGKRHKVTSINPNWSRPWLTGNPEKKDGTFGTAHRNIYGDWTLE